MSIKFGTSGWRGIIADDFTYKNVRNVVAAIGQMLRENESTPKVVIGYDPRFLSPELSREATRVLAAMGVSSILTPRSTPTPVLSWFCRENKLSGIINFTASHNPSEYNGIKFSGSDGGPAVPEVTSKIEKLIQTVRCPEPMDFEKAKSTGLIEVFDPREGYLNAVKKILLTSKMKPFKIAIDHLFGASIGYPEEILRELGFEIATIHSHRDTLFGGMRPEPEGHSIKELQDLVLKGSYTLGIACDGDADRFGIIDPDGSFITPNQLIALLTRHLSRSRGWSYPVVRTNATTHLIDRLAKIENLEVIETAVGFKYIGEIMNNQDITIGGEESGGLSIHGWIPEKDGILAVLLATEMVSMTGQSPKELLNKVFSEVGTVVSTRIDLRMAQEAKEKLVRFWLEFGDSQVADFQVVSKDSLDGPRVMLEGNRWLLIRPSGTEPVVRCYLEAESEESLAKIAKALKDSIPS